MKILGHLILVQHPSAFYQAFDNSGIQLSKWRNPGLVDLVPHLSNLGFEDNGTNVQLEFGKW